MGRDYIQVDLGDSFNIVQVRGYGYWDVLRLDCGAHSAVDVDRDGRVDAIGCEGTGKYIVTNEKYRAEVKRVLARDAYEEAATKEEVKFAQKKFDEGMALGLKRFAELKKALEHPENIRRDEVNVGFGYRYDTYFRVDYDEKEKKITGITSTDRDLCLLVSGQALAPVNDVVSGLFEKHLLPKKGEPSGNHGVFTPAAAY